MTTLILPPGVRPPELEDPMDKPCPECGADKKNFRKGLANVTCMVCGHTIAKRGKPGERGK